MHAFSFHYSCIISPLEYLSIIFGIFCWKYGKWQQTEKTKEKICPIKLLLCSCLHHESLAQCKCHIEQEKCSVVNRTEREPLGAFDITESCPKYANKIVLNKALKCHLGHFSVPLNSRVIGHKLIAVPVKFPVAMSHHCRHREFF